MKKTISVLALLVVFFCSSIASARLNDSEIALGGLAPGMDIAYAISIYGQPDEVHEKRFYYWGKDFMAFISIDLSGFKAIDSISTSANNGISTPAGLHVGCKVDDMLKMYGKPDSCLLENKEYNVPGDSYDYYSLKYTLSIDAEPSTNVIKSIRVSKKG